MDEYAFHTSTAEQDSEFLFSNRQFVFVPDQNNATYANSQVLFDLASFSNSGKLGWFDGCLRRKCFCGIS